ncbi:MAG: anaerobic sulfite reductase subunit AsrB, partial [Lachnospiraceae bacterium]|nr:anaerobic sulfite reductase subunit AsrB [Lachnospiraceae bacterium]
MNNEYLPFPSQVKEIIRHTDIEYTFRMSFSGEVRPGQFFEVSIPKFGEAPISVSGIGPDTVDLTIRRVGTVTSQIFEHYKGSTLLMRGPYGNGFWLEDYLDRELFVIAGGTGISPVKGIVDHFSDHPEQVRSMTLIAGFRSPSDILFRNDFVRWEKTMEVIRTVDAAP